MTQGIRIMIVDDHEVVRVGLKTVLSIEEDLDVVGEAGSGAEALQKYPLLLPQVVLLDVLMPQMSGIETCRELLVLEPKPKVLMLTSYSGDDAVVSAIMAGASGYLLKNVGRQEIVKAIRTVAAGGALLDPAVTRKVTDHLVHLSNNQPKEQDPLSEREREILGLVAQGLTNKEIASKLVISEKTARNHVSHILEKLNLSRRSEAAAYAARRGMVK